MAWLVELVMKKYLTIVLVLLLFSACSTISVEQANSTLDKPTTLTLAPADGASATATRELIATSVARIRATRTALAQDDINSTATIMALTPSLTSSQTATNTVTPSITPTWTPVSTISQDIQKKNLQELLLTNGWCDFPCWWGVYPKAPLQDALALSPILGTSPYIYENQYAYLLSLDELNLADLDVTFFEEERAVEKSKVSLEQPSRHADYLDAFENALSLSSILTYYGKPSDVLLNVRPRSEKDSPIGYKLTIIYEDRGFAVQYGGVVNSEEPIQICVILADYHLRVINLFLQDSQAMGLLRDEITAEKYFFTHLAIEDVTSMDSDGFYQTFSSSENTNCIETAIDYWE